MCGDSCLLSAGKAIKLWDLDTKQLIKKFTGHSSDIFKLTYVPFSASKSENGSSALDAVENNYFISAACGDRLINAWQIKSSKENNAIGSFALPEEPVQVDVCTPLKKDQPSLLAAVTRSGQLLIYEHVLNGKCKKPIRPKFTIQVATQRSDEDRAKPIQILAANITSDQHQNILFAYGNFLKPSFEKMPYSSIDSDVCLVREDPTKFGVVSESVIAKVKTPDTTQEVMVLAPSHMTPSGPVQPETTPGKTKRKKRKSNSQEMSMEDRLNAISIDTGASAQQPPTTDTLANLLSQGLQSQDKKILNNVLQNTNETVIRNTVKRLPVRIIVPLVQELSHRMHGHAQSGLNLLKWIKTVLSVHTSYLMTFPELVENLGSLYQLMDSRVTTFARLSRLQGKLDLVLTQICSQGQEEEDPVSTQSSLLLFQDESSDEDVFDDMMAGDSDEENWEDLSDVDEEDKEPPVQNGDDDSEKMDED